MKVIIAGSRIFNSPTILDLIIPGSEYHITEIVCGMARGIDMLGYNYGMKNNIPVKEFPANWKRFGKKAGHIRNWEMGEYADSAIIIWDGESRGTQSMIHVMKELNKPYELSIVEGY